MKRSLEFFLCILVLLAATRPAVAQQDQTAGHSEPGQTAQTPAPVLTLSGAFDLAVKQNLDLQAARMQRAVALAGVKIAGERPNPTASFATLRDTPHQSLFFDQQIETASKRKKRIDLAKQEGLLTATDIAATERQVRRSVREAYFGLAFARRVTSEKSDIAQLALRLKDIAEARFQAGDIAQLELTQAQLEWSRANADAQIAKRDEQIALTQLNLLLNEPSESDWDLADGLEKLPGALTLDDLVTRATQSNSDMARLAQEAKVEESRAILYKAERIPNLGIEFGMDFNAPGQDGFRIGPRGQITMELPLFNRNQGEIAQTSAALAAIEGQEAAKKRAIAAEVESSYYELTSREAEVALYRQELVPSSRKLADLTEESYQSGKANILMVIGAQRDVQQVDSEYLNSLLAMQTSIAALEEIVGTPLE
ncbi:MAG: TolC family protein [Candidatus Acidiferrales bacterium]